MKTHWNQKALNGQYWREYRKCVAITLRHFSLAKWRQRKKWLRARERIDRRYRRLEVLIYGEELPF